MNLEQQERTFIKLGNDQLNLQVTAIAGAPTAAFSCEDEYCGDSETGFGALVTVWLSLKEVLELQEFLDAWLKTQVREEEE